MITLDYKLTILGWNRIGGWTVRGKKSNYGTVKFVKFSQSSIYALTVDMDLLRVWSCNEGGMRSVKVTISTEDVPSVYLHRSPQSRGYTRTRELPNNGSGR